MIAAQHDVGPTITCSLDHLTTRSFDRLLVDASLHHSHRNAVVAYLEQFLDRHAFSGRARCLSREEGQSAGEFPVQDQLQKAPWERGIRHV
jgi:hypothetical protein